MPGLSFDHVADHYDATRGGTVRGEHFAGAIAPWLLGPRAAELGIGTGVIAAGLLRHGIAVTGVDISEAMMRAAVGRVGNVDDPAATLTEASRVVRPGGRIVAVAADPDDRPDDEIAAILRGLAPLKRPGRSATSIAESAPQALELEHRGFTPWTEFTGSAADQIDLIERRSYSTLFDVGDDDWTAVVDPVLDRLRALPDPARQRTRCNRHPLLVWRNHPDGEPG